MGYSQYGLMPITLHNLGQGPVHTLPYFQLPLTAISFEKVSVRKFWIQVFALPLEDTEIPLSQSLYPHILNISN